MFEEQRYYKRRKRDLFSGQVVSSTVKEILKQAKRHSLGNIDELRVLDVGCGSGEYSIEMAKFVSKVVGVEPFTPAYQKAIQNQKDKKNLLFVNSKIEDFKSREKFDLIMSITTIEHMPEAKKSFNRIFELLKPGGVLYLTAPNKWWPIEQHYLLPFLGWLPLVLANRYMQIFGKGESYKDYSYAKSYFGMKRFFDKFPCRYEFILPSDSQAEYLGCGSGGKVYRKVVELGIKLIRLSPYFWNFSKGFIIVAVKS
ncbi:MAG: class I SAM-dependent methyltransferase [Patescibacteria group bacterium]